MSLRILKAACTTMLGDFPLSSPPPRSTPKNNEFHATPRYEHQGHPHRSKKAKRRAKRRGN